MKSKSVVVGVRLPEGVKDKLQELADEDHRPLSNFISKILLDYLNEQGIEVKKEKPTE
ncbi:MAG: Arc family DNA-binding protein [Deltaproteobacteria bacterium]|nr:MAG: Arc family DNA-binding protein [Deltaproteobacteria bacterium]